MAPRPCRGDEHAGVRATGTQVEPNPGAILAIQRITFSAVTDRERHEATTCIRNAIGSAGGWVEDVHFYSNVSLAVTAVVPAGKMAALGEALVECALRLNEETLVKLASIADIDAPDEEVICGLEVTFFHNEPDLRRPVPAVPG